MTSDDPVHSVDILNEMNLEIWDEDVAHEETIGVDADEDFIEVEGDEEDTADEYMDIGDPRQFGELSNGSPVALLPIRDGRAVFSLNLPDLISQEKILPNGASMYLCFSKKCVRQLAFDGYIYNIAGHVNPLNYNIWRCTSSDCPGAVRSSPNYEALKIRSDHMDGCLADDAQVRLRIAVYDLRLMAEFTDIPLGALYSAFVEKVRTEHSDIAHLIPPLEVMRSTLEHHRCHMIYRKRFEIRKQMWNRKRAQGNPQPSASTGVFKRTKSFPPSICVDCSAEFRSNQYAPSHDLLIEHLTYLHDRPLCIERFTFPDAALFEQWIRELQMHSRYRLRKLGLYDEHMYYLCQSDDRLQRCNHGKGNILNTQCTAFVRVHDWRFILRREIKPVVVDYCLDHNFHTGSSPLPESFRQPFYDYYSPETFMKELAIRRIRTDDMIQNSEKLQRIKRNSFQQMITSTQHSTVAATGGRSTRSNYSAKAGGDELDSNMDLLADHCEEWAELTEDGSPRKPMSTEHDMDHIVVAASKSLSKPPTESEDRLLSESIRQMEGQWNAFRQRMQHCRRSDVAGRYLSRFTSIVDDVYADPCCAPRTSDTPSQEDKDSRRKSVRAPCRSLNDGIHENTMVLHKEQQGQPCEDSVPDAYACSSNTDIGEVRQAMFLKRDVNGKMVVVKRTLRQARRSVEMAEEPAPITSSYSINSTGNMLPAELQDNVLEDEEIFQDANGSSPSGNMFMETPDALGEVAMSESSPIHRNRVRRVAYSPTPTPSVESSPCLPVKRPRGRPRKVRS